MKASAEALVVGAGIVGAACAEALAQAGWRVRVLECARVAGAATAAGMGHILVLDDSPAQWALTHFSRALWDERAARWPKAVERELTGTIWVAADAAEMAAVEAKQQWYGARGVAAEVLDPAALYQHEPHLRAGLAGGLRIPGDSVVYPPAAALSLLARAEALGAQVESGCSVERCGNGTLELADGRRLEADVVVVAAGNASPKLVGLPANCVRPKKGHLAITERVPGYLRHQLVELGYLKSAHGAAQTSVAFNAQPRATGQILLGSSRQVDCEDTRVEPAILSRMLQRACSYLPGLADLTVVRSWTGLRPATRDNLPLIGPLAGKERLWLATGHEGLGITTSLGTARLLCDQLLGQKSAIDPTPYRLERLATEVQFA